MVNPSRWNEIPTAATGSGAGVSSVEVPLTSAVAEAEAEAASPRAPRIAVRRAADHCLASLSAKPSAGDATSCATVDRDTSAPSSDRYTQTLVLCVPQSTPTRRE